MDYDYYYDMGYDNYWDCIDDPPDYLNSDAYEQWWEGWNDALDDDT